MSRGNGHPGWDRLDTNAHVVITLSAMVFNLVVLVPLDAAIHGGSHQASYLSFLVFLAVTALSNGLVFGIGTYCVRRFVRPRIFDREQRHHEIVPSLHCSSENTR